MSSYNPYSDTNPVPTIQKFEEEKARQQKELETEINQEQPTRSNTKDSDTYSGDEEDPADKSLTEGQKEKKEMMNKMQPSKGKPTDQVKKTRGQRVVDDPVTGEKVMIKDAKFKDFPTQQQLDPKSGVAGPATKGVGSAAAQIFHQSKTAPDPAHPSNISLQPFPPSTPPSLDGIMNHLYYLEYGIMAAGCLLWFFFAFGHGVVSFLFRSILIGALSFGGATVASLAQRKLEHEIERVRFDMHRQRGEQYAPPTPESVEWLNAFTKVIWGLINPDMFVPIADSIEDVMQQSLPKFVEAVRISDIGQGTNPFRIVSMRALPDQPGEKAYPREEWIDQGTNKLLDESKKAQKGKDLDQAGDYVNYEVSFAYQAMPGQGDQLRAKNIHLLLEFFLGFADWVHIPIPIWVQVDGIAGTVRLRLQFIPEPPYVRNLTFTLMGVPAVEVSVIPLIKKLPNILDLPLISTFVKMAIRAGTASLVAPKSMTLNLQEMLSGAVIGDTRALGVFIIRIQYAEDLSAQDRNGKSDPYIVLAYAKFGKPLYSSRIILGDLNPVFEETAFMLVTHEEVKADEKLAAMLWDSDRHTADDLIGRVQIPVKELMSSPNQMVDRADKLAGFEDATAMSGVLHWSIGYFDKVPLNKDLERPEENPPPAKKSSAAMEMRPGDKAPNPAAMDGPPPAPDVQRTPPDPKYPSGILSVVIHQINNLERQNLKGASGDREGMAGQDTDEPSEQGNNLPSGYCEIIINDDLVYKTRVKQYTSMPYFEAGTETFIRDWQNTVIRVVARDSRLREKDPILGIVSLPLAEVLSEASEVTSLYSLQEGVGFGRVNISILFKAVDAKLPRNMLGWDTGTVEIINPIDVKIDSENQSSFALSKQALVVSTTDSTEKIGSATVDGDNAQISWNVDTVRLPVYSRYSSSLTFEIGAKSGFGPLKGQPSALAILWLQDIPDDETVDVKLPIIVSKDLRQLRQNYVNEHTSKGHAYKTIGWLTTKVRIDKGLDPDHEKYAKSQARRHAYETYDHIEGQAIVAERNAHAYDDGVITKEEKKELDAAHKKQLHNRHRGVAQYRPYRTAVWMKEGVKRRLTFSKGNGKREPTVKSEA